MKLLIAIAIQNLRGAGAGGVDATKVRDHSEDPSALLFMPLSSSAMPWFRAQHGVVLYLTLQQDTSTVGDRGQGREKRPWSQRTTISGDERSIAPPQALFAPQRNGNVL